MADRKIVEEWLRKAEDDFNFASINLEEDNQFYSQICFHFHQAAEKYLKAIIVAYDLEFEKVHDLIRLCKICSRRAPLFSSVMEECIFLNTSYIDTRYPVSWPTNYTKEKALKCREAALKIGAAVNSVLG